eukprot:TRINITY_DN3251_c0_g1_i6.p1 TRINITY_DN3251_c0_g1~~TRINITY_DN3251_c0_g1_i6.p1  ORF type:complete len:196 (+),score=-27.55 TRINITY_DN3251_c0_g1_i6:304-891(+)
MLVQFQCMIISSSYYSSIQVINLSTYIYISWRKIEELEIDMFLQQLELTNFIIISYYRQLLQENVQIVFLNKQINSQLVDRFELFHRFQLFQISYLSTYYQKKSQKKYIKIKINKIIYFLHKIRIQKCRFILFLQHVVFCFKSVMMCIYIHIIYIITDIYIYIITDVCVHTLLVLILLYFKRQNFRFFQGLLQFQ